MCRGYIIKYFQLSLYHMMATDLEKMSNFSRNFQIIKAQTIDDGFKGLQCMTETSRRLAALKSAAYSDLRPVSYEEGVNIFNTYYNRQGVSGNIHKLSDYTRKRKGVLTPDSRTSYLYRPKNAVSGPSGPALYDMENIDDAPSLRIGEGLPGLDEIEKKMRDRHTSHKKTVRSKPHQ